MKWLKNPYPFIFEGSNIQLKVSLMVFVFVSLFLYIFKPFNFETVILIADWKAALVYGGIAGGVCLVVTKLLIAFAPNYTAEENWTVGRQLFFLNFMLLSCTVMNFVISHTFEIHDFSNASIFASVKQDLIYTYSIGFFPVLIVTLIGFYIRLKKNLAAAEDLNKRIESAQPNEVEQDVRLRIPSNAKSEDLEINLQDLIFVMADGNYVEFHLHNEGKTDRKIIRNTMRNVADCLDDFEFLFRSHRAYIVNLNYIQESSGNAQGYQLKMRNTDAVLPVSRTYLGDFKDVIEAEGQNSSLHFVPNV
jgi:LytTr DNA-binding domain